MWVLPTHVHPDVRDLWRDLGERIAAKASPADHPRRIFCSRRRSRRSCHNLAEVEELFRQHGFTVVYPEDLAFVDQVEMFRQAEVVAGFAGSAMFTSLFCPTPRHLIVLGPTSYPSRNEYMICAAVGHRLDHVWSEPDPQEAAGDLPQYAGFRFDFDREGSFLRQILAEL
jgi:capsular polysaccharide biosynthesis protein